MKKKMVEEKEALAVESVVAVKHEAKGKCLGK